MWRHQKLQKHVFFVIFCLGKSGCGDVAICGDIKNFKKTVFFIYFGKIGLWRCGDMWRHQKWQKNVVFSDILGIFDIQYFLTCF